jgi:hypothetical protein
MSLYSDFLSSIETYLNRHAVPRFIESQGKLVENPGIVVVMNSATYNDLASECWSLHLYGQTTQTDGTILGFPYSISNSKVWVNGDRRKLNYGEFLVVEERFFSMVCPDDEIRRLE